MEFMDKWFEGFNEGIKNLTYEECSRLFKLCAAQCAKDALKYLYQDLFEQCQGNLNQFFTRMGEVNGVDGRVVKPGKVYEIIFLDCNCDLHTCAHVNSEKLCECSRQSILCVLNTLVPGQEFSVSNQGTILGGKSYCLFRIECCK